MLVAIKAHRVLDGTGRPPIEHGVVDGDRRTDVACLQRVGLIMQGGRRRDALTVE